MRGSQPWEEPGEEQSKQSEKQMQRGRIWPDAAEHKTVPGVLGGLVGSAVMLAFKMQICSNTTGREHFEHMWILRLLLWDFVCEEH